MKKLVATIIAITILVPAALAQVGPTVTQSEIDCAAPNAFIKILVNAGVPAGESIDAVRVYFRSGAATGDVWYWVDAVQSGQYWTAIIPAPLRGVGTIQYRSEVRLDNGANASTEVRTVDVRDDCPASTLSESDLQHADSMTVGTTSSQPTLPEGFSSAGIVTILTEGGTMVAATTLGGVGAGAAAVGGAGAAGGTILGMSAGTAAIVGAGLVGGAIIIENNKDDSPN